MCCTVVLEGRVHIMMIEFGSLSWILSSFLLFYKFNSCLLRIIYYFSPQSNTDIVVINLLTTPCSKLTVFIHGDRLSNKWLQEWYKILAVALRHHKHNFGTSQKIWEWVPNEVWFCCSLLIYISFSRFIWFNQFSFVSTWNSFLHKLWSIFQLSSIPFYFVYPNISA